MECDAWPSQGTGLQRTCNRAEYPREMLALGEGSRSRAQRSRCESPSSAAVTPGRAAGRRTRVDHEALLIYGIPVTFTPGSTRSGQLTSYHFIHDIEGHNQKEWLIFSASSGGSGEFQRYPKESQYL